MFQTIRKEFEDAKVTHRFEPIKILTQKPVIQNLCDVNSCLKKAASPCTGCKLVWYCSPRCRETDYEEGHKWVCSPLDHQTAKCLIPKSTLVQTMIMTGLDLRQPVNDPLIWRVLGGRDAEHDILFPSVEVDSVRAWALASIHCGITDKELDDYDTRARTQCTIWPGLFKRLATHWADCSSRDSAVATLIKKVGCTPDERLVLPLYSTLLDRGANLNQRDGSGSLLNGIFGLPHPDTTERAVDAMEVIVAYERLIWEQLKDQSFLFPPLLRIVWQYLQVDFGL